MLETNIPLVAYFVSDSQVHGGGGVGIEDVGRHGRGRGNDNAFRKHGRVSSFLPPPKAWDGGTMTDFA